MCSLNRILAAFWLLLAISACAPPAATLPPTSEAQPTADHPPTPVHIPVAYDASLPAIVWDEKTRENLLMPLDPNTGEAVPGYEPVSLGRYFFHAYSPTRRLLASVSFPTQDLVKGTLVLVDLGTWGSRKYEANLRGGSMVFSPGGDRLAIVSGDHASKVTIFDLESGVITAEAPLEILVWRLRFTSDGDALMLYGPVFKNRFTTNEMSAGPPQVLLLDASNLSPRWSAELDGVRDGIVAKDENKAADLSQPGTAMYLSPATAFAPDRDMFYVVHADSDRLTTVDFAEQKVETVDIGRQLGWIERLLSLTAGVAHAKVADGTRKQAVVSPDGRLLYVVGERSSLDSEQNGDWQVSQIPLGLDIIRAADRTRLAHIDTDAVDLSLSHDGRFLYLRHWGNGESGEVPWTGIFDTSKREIVTRKAGVYAMLALRVNGEPLLVSSFSLTESLNQMSILRTDNLEVLSEWTDRDFISWLTPE